MTPKTLTTTAGKHAPKAPKLPAKVAKKLSAKAEKTAPKAAKASGKVEKKADKKAEKAPAKADKKSDKKGAIEAPAMPVLNNDDDADLAELEEAANSSSSGTGGAEAAASSSSSLTQKNFRNHPDMENFFRFIYENDLRLEALEIIDQIIVERAAKKAKAH